MAHINLLPWREEQRKEKTQHFATVLGLAAIMAIALVALVHIRMSGVISGQNARNQIFIDETAKLDVALKEIQDLEATKAKLLSRMEVIQSLQQRRPQVVHLFDELVRTVPEGIYLSEIKQVGENLTINGVAESNGRVSAYMRNIDASEWMATPKLKVIETKKGTLRSNNFVLTTSQSAPKDEAGDES